MPLVFVDEAASADKEGEADVGEDSHRGRPGNQQAARRHDHPDQEGQVLRGPGPGLGPRRHGGRRALHYGRPRHPRPRLVSNINQ